MANLSDFKRGQMIGTRMAGAGVTKTTELFYVASSAVSKVMTPFKKEGKISSRWSKTLEERWGPSDYYAVCLEGSQEYSSENYSRA